MTWERAKRWLLVHGGVSFIVLLLCFVISLMFGALLLRTAAMTVVGFIGGKVASWLDKQEL